MTNEKPLKKPVDFDELYPGRFIKSGEFLGKKITLTIADVNIERLGMDADKKVKGIVAFRETDKQWVLNRTNGECLKAMFGRTVSGWVGKRVTLFPMSYQGETAIRVWGSPELASDQVVTIALPRKRPFDMTMHAPAPKGKATSKPTPIDDAPPAAYDEPPPDEDDNN
jgi:hypothetical protein